MTFIPNKTYLRGKLFYAFRKKQSFAPLYEAQNLLSKKF